MSRKTRCRDLIGKRVALTRNITTSGGVHHRAGDEFTVATTWRGRFFITSDRGGIRHVRRSEFDVIHEGDPAKPPRIDAVVRVDAKRGIMWVMGDPYDLMPGDSEDCEAVHNCDQMGCGSAGMHVIGICRFGPGEGSAKEPA